MPDATPTTAGDRPSDTGWAAFTDDAPWVLDRDDISWLALAGRLRDAARAEVPGLTRP